ncbi:MAG: glycosyltransferase family 4 protein [Chitinophagaceae bacterium]|nr:glycosyltransferase family 4 protein [Anaerolineae bacterium]
MRIAILDYFVIKNNAIGNCDRRIMQGLCDEHEFTVFSVTFDNPNPEKIKFVRVPAIKRPLFALFITYHLLIPFVMLIYRLRHRVKFDVVQSIESNSLLGTLVYAHFCHDSYLKHHYAETRPPGIRGVARWLDHKLHALLERPAFSKAKSIIVPSHGLARELAATYGGVLGDKVKILANPIDINHMRRPDDFDSEKVRADLKLSPDDLMLVFVALGHFERKGLPLLLEAMSIAKDERVKLVVVGGTPAVMEEYQRRAEALKLKAGQVVFTGMQKDIRPYLWAADIFSLPSAYEVFPLVSLESAGAGLPLLVSKLNGVEEFLVDGVNGWCVERTAAALAEKIVYSMSHRDQLREMGQNAMQSVVKYDVQHFVEDWRQAYRALSSS